MHYVALDGQYTWGSTLGKVHLGECTHGKAHLGEYTREGTLEKVHRPTACVTQACNDACVKCKRARSELPVVPGSGSSWVTCASQVRAAGCSNTRAWLSTRCFCTAPRLAIQWESALGKVHLGRYTYGKVHLGKCNQEGTPKGKVHLGRYT